MVLKVTRSAFAVADETVWGTFVTPTRFYLLEDGGQDFHVVTDRGFVASASEGFLRSTGVVPGVHHTEGNVSIICTFSQLGKLLKHIFGAASAAPVVSDTTAGTHTWFEDPTFPIWTTNPSLSVEVPWNTIGTGSKGNFTGSKIREARFHIETGDAMRLDLDMVGKTVAPSATTPTAYVFPASPIIAANNLGSNVVLSVQGITLRPRNFSLTIRTGVQIASPTIDQTTIPEPIRGGTIEVEWEAECEADDTALVDEMVGNNWPTILAPVIFRLESTLAGAATARNAIQFSMPWCVINAGGDPHLDRLGEPTLLHLEGRATREDEGVVIPPTAKMITTTIVNRIVTADA